MLQKIGEVFSDNLIHLFRSSPIATRPPFVHLAGCTEKGITAGHLLPAHRRHPVENSSLLRSFPLLFGTRPPDGCRLLPEFCRCVTSSLPMCNKNGRP